MLCSNKFFSWLLSLWILGKGKERERNRLTIWAECFLKWQKASKMQEFAVLTVPVTQLRPLGSLRLKSAPPRTSESHLTPYKKPPKRWHGQTWPEECFFSLFNQQLLVNLATSMELKSCWNSMNRSVCLTFPSSVGKSAMSPSSPASSLCKIIPSSTLEKFIPRCCN